MVTYFGSELVNQLANYWHGTLVQISLSFSVFCSLPLPVFLQLDDSSTGLVSRISPLLRRYARAMEKRAGPRLTDELQKLTYPTKMFSFQPHTPPNSSAEQSSITELLHFANLLFSLSPFLFLLLSFPPSSRDRDEVRLSEFSRRYSFHPHTAVCSFVRSPQQKLQIAYCFTLILFRPFHKTRNRLATARRASSFPGKAQNRLPIWQQHGTP